MIITIRKELTSLIWKGYQKKASSLLKKQASCPLNKQDQCGYILDLHIWSQPNTAYHKHLILTVKHGGGGLMIWVRFAALHDLGSSQKKETTYFSTTFLKIR